MMATIVHFDISADNLDRAKVFYEKLFNWKIELLPGPTDYYLIETRNYDGETGIGGGIAQRENPGDGIVNFIGVSSIDSTMEKVKSLGGKVVHHKSAVPGWGYMALCLDTEDNTFGLWQDDSGAV